MQLVNVTCTCRVSWQQAEYSSECPSSCEHCSTQMSRLVDGISRQEADRDRRRRAEAGAERIICVYSTYFMPA